MNGPAAHRGPDGEGYFVEGPLSLGHRRLAVIELSAAGRQPMSLAGRYTIVYNGEIYNYIEVREELKTCGYSFSSASDTEVILTAYHQWGAACVERFNGMWAFAIFDRQLNKLFCSRDRFGVKPLYYAVIDNQFIFGSEIKQLLPFFATRRVNLSVLIDYLVTGFVDHTDQTFFEGILKLPPGHHLTYDLNTHKHKPHRYYRIRLRPEVAKLDEAESIEALRRELDRAVAIRLRSDVKVGTCLSGGLDSSSIATLASRSYHAGSNEQFNAITAKSMDPSEDESAYAGMIASESGLSWHCIEPTTDDFLQNIDEVIYTQEEPFGTPSIFMQYFVMKKARELGCTVMLDGQGADETLLGYNKYFPAAYIHFFRTIGFFKTAQEIIKTPRNNTKMDWREIAFYTAGSLLPGLRKQVHRRQCAFLKDEFWSGFSHLDALAKSYFSIEALQALEIERTHLPALLRFEDKNSMRHSVEARLPYLDFNVLETAVSLNPNFKIKNGWTKYSLRKAMRPDLPEEIVWRKDKLAFNAPDSIWMPALQCRMAKILEASAIIRAISDMPRLKRMLPRLPQRLQWRLFNVAKWEEIFGVTIN
jgi:asparagine synthase (glutamine-hydrolysing)